MNKFGSSEKLKSKILITALFQQGETIRQKGMIVRYIFQNAENNPTAQVAFSVPKKIVKSAVKRNLIKRRMREAYRLQKSAFLEKVNLENKQVFILFIHTAHEISLYQDIYQKISLTLDRLLSHIHEKTPNES